MTLFANELAQNVNRIRLAEQLGVSVESLKLLGVGWHERFKATSWPMQWRVNGPIHGIRYRRMDGRKFSERGGRDGVFVPLGVRPGMELLVVAEGGTDTAAALTLGLPAIGRPSAATGHTHILSIVNSLRPKIVLITADYEPHGIGQWESERLARLVASNTASLVFVWDAPPNCKDLRGWVRAGGTAEMLRGSLEVPS